MSRSSTKLDEGSSISVSPDSVDLAWTDTRIEYIDPREIVEDPKNPFRGDAMNISTENLYLEASIKTHGILIPIHIRPINEVDKREIMDLPEYHSEYASRMSSFKYMIIDGERRFRSSQYSFSGEPLGRIRCIIFNDRNSVGGARAHQTIVNLKQRKTFDPWMVCKAFVSIMNSKMFNQAQLANYLNENKQYVSKILSLQHLDKRIHAAMEFNRFQIQMDEDGKIKTYTDDEKHSEGQPIIKELPQISLSICENLLNEQKIKKAVQRDDETSVDLFTHKEIAVRLLHDKLAKNDPRRALLALDDKEELRLKEINKTRKIEFEIPRERAYVGKPRFACEINFTGGILKPTTPEEAKKLKKNIKLEIPWQKDDDDIASLRDIQDQIKGISRYLKNRLNGKTHEEAIKELNEKSSSDQDDS